MSNTSSGSSKSGGIGFFRLLAIAFIVLKLTGHIEWSWLWVLAPIWGPLSCALAIVIGALALAVLAEVLK